jgi:predicted ATP-binding protein involved in virulence
MRIKELSLRNFRGFKELQIKFPSSNLLVLVGINGAGKSSILDSVAMLLSLLVSGLCGKTSRENEFLINENDIHIDAQETMNSITIENIPADSASGSTFSWAIAKNRIPGKYRPTKNPGYADYIDQVYRRLKMNPGLNLPVLTYYRNQKIFLEKPAKYRQKTYEFSQLYVFENAFKKGIQSFEDFVTWFRLEEDWENEKKIEKGLDFVNNHLEVVRKALKIFIEKLSAMEFSHLHVVRGKRDKGIRFNIPYESSLVIEKTGKPLKLEQLSDGEIMLLLVVGDLARRLAVANPALADPLQGEGIVLIDGIDLHLHPQWQREVIPAFRSTFPNCQFIVTTHSPQVLSNVERENIMILENCKIVENTPYTYGRDSNSILYDLMKIEERPTAVKKELDKLYRLIDNDNIEEARKEIEKLAGVLGESDKDIIRANMYINFQGS